MGGGAPLQKGRGKGGKNQKNPPPPLRVPPGACRSSRWPQNRPNKPITPSSPLSRTPGDRLFSARLGISRLPRAISTTHENCLPRFTVQHLKRSRIWRSPLASPQCKETHPRL